MLTGKILFFSFFISVLLLGCSGNPDDRRNQVKMISRDTLMEYNRGISRNEDQEIMDFVERYGWDMTTTSTGLRYMIYHRGEGPRAQKDKIAVCKYSVKLLNGNLLYSSEKDGVKEFRIGHGGVESGLEEGILLLRVGDKVKFIVPSHLAFGLLGDQNKIPPGATLVYDLELVNLK